MDARLLTLIQDAGTAATAGRWQDAERLWMQVRALDPKHVQALFSLGVHAYQRGDFVGALELLHAARIQAPRDPMIPLTISVVHRNTDDSDREWSAIIDALAIDPYFLPGLLSKGEFLERKRKPKAAAAVFRDVIKVVPHESQWPPALQRRLEHACDAVKRDTEELMDYLNHKVAAERTVVDAALGDRWDEAVSIMAGKTKPYHSECNQLYIPRLPAQTFYDPSLFPWISALEAKTGAIKSELEGLIAERLGDFKPYVAYKPGDPVNQWKELNHSRAWSSFHLWAHGEPVHENLARCPVTAEALSVIDSVRIAGLCPNAMFSALAPHTHIPPHSGETNARLVAHLPLIVPGECSFRVGYDWRGWEAGKVLVFDDSIEHEARNDSDELRVVLIFDVWNPLLSLAEREMVSALASAMREYRTKPDA